MNDIIENAKKNKLPVGMHCWGGSGRTGTMVASYLMYKMKDTEEAKKNSFVDDVIKETRKLRQGSIEINTQVEALYTYWYYLQEVKKGNEKALEQATDLEKFKKHYLKNAQPNEKEIKYTEENCRKAREYALKQISK